MTIAAIACAGPGGTGVVPTPGVTALNRSAARAFPGQAGFYFLGELPPVVRLAAGPSPLVPGPWFQVAKTGTFFSPVYGKISITADDLTTMYQNFKTKTPLAPTRLPLDYDHLSDEPQKPEDGKAAGWVRDLQVRDNGNTLWCMPDWTRRAAELINNREYAFVSPFFVTDYMDKVSGQKIGPTLKAIAITNRPFLEGMQPLPAIAASERLAEQLWRTPSVAIDSRSLYAADQLRRTHIAVPARPRPSVAIPLPIAVQLSSDNSRGARVMTNCACGAPPRQKPDGTAMSLSESKVKWAEELAGAPGAITCPHCGAPVKHVPAAPPTTAPPAAAAPPGAPHPKKPGDDLADPPAPPAAPPVPEGGGDADALDDMPLPIAPAMTEDAAGPTTPGAKDTLTSAEDMETAFADDVMPPLAEPTALAEPETPKPAVATSMAGEKVATRPPEAEPTMVPTTEPTKMRELQDQIRQLSEKNAITEKALKEVQQKERRRNAYALVKVGLSEGKLTPVLIGTWQKPGWALSYALKDAPGFERWLKETAPIVVDLKERGTGHESGVSVGSVAAAEQINALALQEITANPKLTYGDATRKVIANPANRALAERYDRDTNGAPEARPTEVVSNVAADR